MPAYRPWVLMTVPFGTKSFMNITTKYLMWRRRKCTTSRAGVESPGAIPQKHQTRLLCSLYLLLSSRDLFLGKLDNCLFVLFFPVLALVFSLPPIQDEDCYQCNPFQPNRDKLIRPEPGDDCFHSRESCRGKYLKSIPIHRFESRRPSNENLLLPLIWCVLFGRVAARHRIHNSEGVVPFVLDSTAQAVIRSRPALN